MEAKIQWKELTATFEMRRDEIMYIVIGSIGTTLGGIGLLSIFKAVGG